MNKSKTTKPKKNNILCAVYLYRHNVTAFVKPVNYFSMVAMLRAGTTAGARVLTSVNK